MYYTELQVRANKELKGFVMPLVIYDRDAGMCTGVKRSIEGSLKTAGDVGKNKKIVTYGELIHNPVVIDKLSKRGIRVAYTREEISPGDFVIIRAHGIPPGDEAYLRKRGGDYLDLTCPIVKSIHKKIVKYKKEGFKIVIVGHPQHPETVGHMGYAGESGIVVRNSQEMKKAIQNGDIKIGEKTLLIAQTTISEKSYKEVILESQAEQKGATVLYTICPFVIGRQRWIEEMSNGADAAIIIGGKNSSNTRRLYELAQNNCKTFWIVRSEDLPIETLKNYNRIVLTAGASTSDETMQEVLSLLKNNGFDIREG